MPTVFVINDSGHNFEDAKRFGPLVTLTEGQVNPFHTDRLLAFIEGRLSMSKPEDLLLLCGTPILNTIAAVVFHKKHGTLNVLIWDAKRREYKNATVIERKSELVCQT